MGKMLQKALLWLMFTTASSALWAQNYNVSLSGCATTNNGSVTLNYTNVGAPAGGGTLDLTQFWGDFSAAGEFFQILDENGNIISGNLSTGNDCSSAGSATINLSAADLTAWAADGVISFTATAQNATTTVNNFCVCASPGSTSGNSSVVVYATLDYPQVTGPNNIGVASIDSPLVFCSGPQDVWVTITNSGTNVVDTFTVTHVVNNGTPVVQVYDTIALDTFNGLNPNSVQLFLGTYNISGPTSLQVFTSMPNGVMDTVNLNDTINTMLVPSLNGLYTIDPLGSGGSNYTSFSAAISDLNTYGVCGPVIFEVADNVYSNQQLSFDAIVGSSSTNTITFKSASGDTSACVVDFVPTTTYEGVVKFNVGAEHIHFEDIKFYNPSTSSTYSTVVSFNGNAGNISFEGCRFVNDQASTTSTNATLVYHTSSVRTDSVRFESCTFERGSQGMYWYSSSANPDEYTQVVNCEFVDQYYRGTYLYYQNNAVIEGNTISSSSSYTSGYGLMMYYFTGLEMRVVNNHVYQQPGTSWPRYGMYVYGFTGDFNKFAEVAGNSVSMPNGGTYGIYYYNNLFTEFKNNSIFFSDASINNEGIYVSSGSLNRWYNNAFQAGNQARAAYIATTAAVYESDNNAWSGENNFVYWGGDQADLASLQNASGLEASSVELSNIFADTMNLLVCNDTLDGTGLANPGFMLDKQGDPVDTSAVDIGSDQFATASSFNLRDTVGLCALGDTATLEAWYFDSISWNNGMASGNYYQTTNQGVVVVEAFGVCGSASDTVTVTLATPVDLPATSVVCLGGVGSIDAGVTGGAYAWSNGATTQTIVVTSPGTYEVTVTDVDGCVSDDQTVAEYSVPVDLAEEEALCDGNPVTIDAGIANGTYTWTNGDATQTTTVSTAGMYGVTVTDADGCVSEDMTNVVALSSPVADFTSVSSYYTAEFTNASQNGTSYEWNFGDGSTSTDENPTHLYSFTNDSVITYTVTLVTTNACGSDTVTFEVSVGDAVGISELANGVVYNVYPNPNSGQFTLMLNGVANEAVSYSMVDVQGKVVANQTIGMVSDSYQEQINVSGVAPGIYFLRITIGDQSTIERIAIR